MKTMQLDNKIVRVSDARGANLFLEGWKYVPKQTWKEHIRDTEKNPNDDAEHYTGPEPKKKNNKMSKSAKRHLRKQQKKEKKKW